MTQAPVFEIYIAKSRPQYQQSALDTFCSAVGVIFKRGREKTGEKNNVEIGSEAVFNFNN